MTPEVIAEGRLAGHVIGDVIMAGHPTESWTESPSRAIIGDPPAYRHVTDDADAWNCSVGDARPPNGTGSWTNCSPAAPPTDRPYENPGLGALLSLFALITIFGNLLVIMAVGRERYLRTVTNYFIVSLAVADLIIGGLVMPFAISLVVTGDRWLYGADWCDVWHSLDVLASTASILNLSVISLDRYWAITDPIAYPSRMSVGRALILIALVWICSAAISFPAIVWWRSVLVLPVSPTTCYFTEDSGYLIFSSIISFYFPVSVLLFAYFRIYRAASAQTRSLRIGTKVMTPGDRMNGGQAMTLRIHRGGTRVDRNRPNRNRNRNRNRNHGCRYAPANSDSDSDHVTGGASPGHVGSPAHGYDDFRPSRVISRKWKHFAISRKLSRVAKERKAAKTLGIVIGVFCICWVPFFVTHVLYGACNIRCVAHAQTLFPVFTWLGYINSGMNPVIYAYSMRDFRRAFIRILCACCPTYYFRLRSRRRRTPYDTSGYYMSCTDRPHHRHHLHHEHHDGEEDYHQTSQ